MVSLHFFNFKTYSTIGIIDHIITPRTAGFKRFKKSQCIIKIIELLYPHHSKRDIMPQGFRVMTKSKRAERSLFFHHLRTLLRVNRFRYDTTSLSSTNDQIFIVIALRHSCPLDGLLQRPTTLYFVPPVKQWLDSSIARF
jgi:hypothetical protein